MSTWDTIYSCFYTLFILINLHFILRFAEMSNVTLILAEDEYKVTTKQLQGFLQIAQKPTWSFSNSGEFRSGSRESFSDGGGDQNSI